MLHRILAIFSISVIITKISDGAPAVAKPRQFLPAVSGYIPVYIREGDTPLEDINSELAEAFNSYPEKQARHATSRLRNTVEDEEREKTKYFNDSKENGIDSSVDKDLILEVKSDDETAPKSESNRYLYIQKISRS